MKQNDYKHALPLGTRIDCYKIDSVIGSGGFGITYKALDTSLKYLVAIKEFLPAHLAWRTETTKVVPKSTQDHDNYHYGLNKFIEEGQTLARFKHPNIVRAIRYFKANGTAYLVMEYEHGASFKQFLDKNPRPSESYLLSVMTSMLSGLKDVHSADYLHRDIKPSNIYIRENSEPLLIDFGSSRQSLNSQNQTFTRIVSEGYAPIEQYPSDLKQTPATDLYGLGATLYYAVAGKVPASSLERFNKIQIHKIDPLIPAVEVGADLYSQGFLKLIDWMIQVLPDHRPQSSDQIVNLIKRPGQQTQATLNAENQTKENQAGAAKPGKQKHVEPGPDQADRTPTMPVTGLKYFGQRKTSLGLMLGLALLVTFTSMAAFMWNIGEQPQKSKLLNSEEFSTTPNPVTTSQKLEPVANQVDEKKSQKTKNTQVKTSLGKTAKPADEPITDGSVSQNDNPIGKSPTKIATATAHTSIGTTLVNTSNPADGNATTSSAKIETALEKIWPDEPIDFDGEISKILTNPTSPIIFVGVSNVGVNIINLATGKKLSTLTSTNQHNIALSHNGQYVILHSERYPYIWDTQKKESIQTIESECQQNFIWSPINNQFACTHSRMIEIWNAMSGKQVSSIRTTSPVTLFRYAPDGNKALYIDRSGRAITVVELERGEPISTLRDHRHVFLDAVYLPDSRRILSANNHGRLQLWDIHTRRILLNIPARGQAYFNKVAVSSDGFYAASLSKNNSILLWDLRNGKLVKEFRGHSDDINHISFINNNKKLLSGGHDNMVRIWKLP